VSCIVRTNKEWANSCTIDTQKQTITIVNVFSEESSNFSSSVFIVLTNVVNPLNNKDKGLGFTITTYSDPSTTYRIDTLGNDKMIPTLKCIYPCRTCNENNRDYCQSCWTEAFSDFKYFFETETKGECRLSCPEGYTRNDDSSYVCIRCDSTCGTCLDTDKYNCVACSKEFPYKLSGTGICLQACSRGYYLTKTELTCATCDPICADCEGGPKNCIACDPNSDKPYLFNGTCVGFCEAGYTNVMGKCERCESPCATCSPLPSTCITCDGSLGRRILYNG